MSEPFEFEGDEVTDFTAQLPSASLEAPAAYPRGTLLNLSVQVRVKSVRLEEDRKGNLSRKHILALEDVSILDVLTPAQRKALIEAAEQAAEQQDNTISEEQHIEDVLPGQTTIDDFAVAAAESAETEPAQLHHELAESDTYSPFDREDPRNHLQPGDLENTTKFDYVPDGAEGKDGEADPDAPEWDGDDAIQFAHGKEPISDYEATDDDDEDHEHDWMDEEEDFAHGVRVEVEF